MARLVTLTTDIGWAYAAQMKAVLYRTLLPGSVVDLTHDVPAHSVPEGAFLLQYMAEGFPAGTVHVAVVDPGVGSSRAPLALATADGSVLVGPDNGVLWPLASRLGSPRAVRLDPERVVPGRPPSATFEGRDLFAPAAARLAAGAAIEQLGSPFDPIRRELPVPRGTPESMRGEVLHVDRFGNLITNVPTEWAPPAGARLRVTLGSQSERILSRARTYSDVPKGHAAVFGSSFGLLEVSVREGSAARRFRAHTGQTVRFRSRRDFGGPADPAQLARAT